MADHNAGERLLRAYRWSDFGPEAVSFLEASARVVASDAWYAWWEAIAWVGERDAKNLATLRLLRADWQAADPGSTIVLSFLHSVASHYRERSQYPEQELLSAILNGRVATEGRRTLDAVSEPLRQSGSALALRLIPIGRLQSPR